MFGVGDGERRERDRRRRVRPTVTVARVDLAAVDLELHRHVRDRRRARLVTPAVDRDALLARERRARSATDGTRQFGRLERRDRHRRERHALGEVDLLLPLPAGLLEVADEDRFLARQRRAARGCSPRASAPGRSACASDDDLRRRRSRPRAAPRSDVARTVLLGVSCRTARASRGRRRRAPATTLRARLARALPVVAVAHAGRLIEQDDDLARAGRGGRGLDADPAVKNGRANAATISAIAAGAQQQQQPVVDPAALDRLIRNPPHEHQRRELDDVASARAESGGRGSERRSRARPTKKRGVRKDMTSSTATRINRSRLPR